MANNSPLSERYMIQCRFVVPTIKHTVRIASPAAGAVPDWTKKASVPKSGITEGDLTPPDVSIVDAFDTRKDAEAFLKMAYPQWRFFWTPRKPPKERPSGSVDRQGRRALVLSSAW